MKQLRPIALLLLLALPVYVFGQADEVFCKEAQAYYKQEKYREALNLVDKCLKEEGDNAFGYKLRGDCNGRLDYHKKAVVDYKNALSLDTDLANAYFNMGWSFMYLDMPDSAEYSFRQFMNRKPEDADGYIALGNALQALGKKDALMGLYEKAYALDSTNVMGIFYLAQEYAFANEHEKVIPLADKGKQLDPDNIDWFMFCGNSKNAIGDFAGATIQADSALLLDPFSIKAITLKTKSQIYDMTPKEELYLDEEQNYRFKRHTSNTLRASLAADSLDDFGHLKAKIVNGEVMGLQDYYKYYIGQSLQNDYTPYGTNDIRKMVKQLRSENNFQGIIAKSDEMLDTNPLLLETLFSLVMAAYVVKDHVAYKRFYMSYQGIMAAVMATGTGNTPNEAIVVSSPTDEYAILQYLSLSSEGQNLHNEAGHSYDKLKTVSNDNQRKPMYFNIDMPFGSLNKSFMSARDKKEGNQKKKKKKRKK